MRLSISRFLFLAVAAFAVSCSGFARLLKSEDYKLQFKKAIEYYDEGKYSKTSMLMENIVAYYEGQLAVDTLYYYWGSSYYKQGDFNNSIVVFDEFRKNYPGSPFIEEVEYMYAKSHYFLTPMVERDQSASTEAIRVINEYLERYPNSVKKEALQENVKELMQKLYDKSLASAKLYYDIGYYNAAKIALRNALDAYPESNHREEIMYLLVCANYEYASKSIESMQRQRYMDLQDAYYSFIADYPDSQYRKELDRMQEEAKNYLAKYNTNTTENTTENKSEQEDGNKEE